MTEVYFLEYACTTSFAERANPKSQDEDGFLRKNAYVLLSMSYQVGVFISRSSFYFFKVRRVWIMTYLQTVNFCIFFSVAYWKWLSIEYQIPLMVWVGLMGGCSYVNCLFAILDSTKLSKSQKEVAINVASFLNSISITMSAVFAIFISKFVILNK